MHLHDFLEAVHHVYRPRNYLEIGVDRGQSLSLSRVPSIAIDPNFKITKELDCDLQLVKGRSEDFLARGDALSHFSEQAIDLAFIDGLHLFEAALLDFVNVERLASPTSVVVLDDMLPRSPEEAARSRQTKMWTGDVFKLAFAFERYRPDLVSISVDTEPTGVMLVLALDPSNRLLDERHAELVHEFICDDPQDVPVEVLERAGAADPEELLRAGFWRELVALRDRGDPPAAPEEVQRLFAS